jgi:hypothetical protein
MIRRKFTEFAGVVAGGIAQLIMPLGLTYSGIILKCTALGGGNFANTKLNEVRCILNEKVFYRIPAAKLKKIHAYKAGDASTVFLLIDFTERQAKDIVSELAGVIGTAAGVSSFVIECDIDATATGIRLEARGIVSPGTALSGNIQSIVKRTFNAGGAGEWTIPLPRKADLAGTRERFLKRVYLFDQAGADVNTLITKAVVKKNGVDIHYGERDEDDFIEAHYDGVPDNKMHVIDFVLTNNTRQELVTTSDAEENDLIVTTSGSINIEYYIESLVDIAALGA